MSWTADMVRQWGVPEWAVAGVVAYLQDGNVVDGRLHYALRRARFNHEIAVAGDMPLRYAEEAVAWLA